MGPKSQVADILVPVEWHWNMQYIDSHAHLSYEEMGQHLDEIIQRAQSANVAHILNICTDVATLERGTALSERYPFIKNAAATTPHDVTEQGEPFFPIFEKAAKQDKIVAIGETGLDYHYENSPRELQKHFLVRYLHLALETDKPIIFHCREAFSDLFQIVDGEGSFSNKAVLHCFTGTIDEAEKVLDRGWYLSLSGIVTFKKSIALREVAKRVPLSQLLIETDAPFLAPQSQRGKANEPSFLPEIAQCIAQVKGISVKDVALATQLNAYRLFFDSSKL